MAKIEPFVEHCSRYFYHEILNNVRPNAPSSAASVLCEQRKRIMRQTIEHRRLQHRNRAA